MKREERMTGETGTRHRDRFVQVELRVDKLIEAPDPARLQDLLKDWGLTNAAQEGFWVISYDGARNLRTITPVARGTYHDVTVSIPAILSAVLLSGTDRFIVAHNHPNGDVTPTELDFGLTRQIMQAAATVGIYFEDHVIVGPPDAWHSMAAAAELLPSPDIDAMVAAGHRAGKAGEILFPVVKHDVGGW